MYAELLLRATTLKSQILKVNTKKNMKKTSNENMHFKHGMYLRVTTLKNQILRINIEKMGETSDENMFWAWDVLSVTTRFFFLVGQLETV